MTRILIADDHDVVRSGLRTILEGQPNCEVIAEAADGKEAILKAIETKPDIAVVDYALPLVNGAEVTRQIRARLPKTEVLIFTMHDNETLASHKPFFTGSAGKRTQGYAVGDTGGILGSKNGEYGWQR